MATGYLPRSRAGCARRRRGTSRKRPGRSTWPSANGARGRPIFLAADERRAGPARRGSSAGSPAAPASANRSGHAFITAALDAGVPLRDVQEAGSHADPRTTMRYDNPSGIATAGRETAGHLVSACAELVQVPDGTGLLTCVGFLTLPLA
jgi:integrase